MTWRISLSNRLPQKNLSHSNARIQLPWSVFFMVCPRNLLHPLRNRKKRLMGRFFLHISKKSSTFAAQNRKMRKAQVIVGLLVCVLVSGTLYAKRPVTDVEQARRGGTEVERLQRAIKKQPGDMDKHCELVQAQLAAGDTTAAEKSIEYALKMRETPCLYMQRATIGVARGDLFAAARYSAQAVKAGLRPSEDSAVYRIDSLSGGGVTLCLQRLAGEERVLSHKDQSGHAIRADQTSGSNPYGDFCGICRRLF